jgi:hypothetical protein
LRGSASNPLLPLFLSYCLLAIPPFSAFLFCASHFVPFPPKKHPGPALFFPKEKTQKEMLQQA